jgi:imidazolonepropionase-like amidohydrolase
MKTKTNFTLIALALFWVRPLAAQNPASEPVTLFQNVRIFDGKSGALSAPSHLLVRGNKIEKISTTPLPVDRRADTVFIEGGGHTLMPGLD